MRRRLLTLITGLVLVCSACSIPGLGEVQFFTPNGWVVFQESLDKPLSYTCLDGWRCDDGRYTTFSVNDGFWVPPGGGGSVLIPSFNDETVNPTETINPTTVPPSS